MRSSLDLLTRSCRPPQDKRARTLSRLGALCFGLGLLAACFPGPSDSPGQVHDLRILAMRLDPPEIELPLLPTAPALPVKIEALVAGLFEGRLTLSLRGCPDPGAAACADSLADPTDPVLLPLLETHDQSFAIPNEGGEPDLRFADQREFGAPLMAALLDTAKLGGLAGARPAFELNGAGPQGQEVAFKRLQISYPDAIYRAILEQAGLKICDAQGRPLGCLAYKTRVINHNPTLNSLSWQSIPGAEAGETPTPIPDTGLEVAAGTTVRIYPDLAMDAAESYQTLGVNLDDQTLFASDYEELLTISWFKTTGSFALNQTVPGRTFGAFNDFTAPMEPGVSDLWIVVRDNRGGVAFAHSSVTVTP